jgi:sensor histidine kinase YesM
MVLLRQTFIYIILLVAVFFDRYSNVYAQAKERNLIDSLSKIVDLNSTDTGNIRNICRLSGASFIIQYDKGIELGQTALKLAQQIKNKPLEAHALESIGRNYWGKSNYPEALRFHTLSLGIYSELKDYRGMVRTHMLIASSAFAQNQLFEAEKYYLLALSLAEKQIKDPILIAGNNGIYQSIAMTYLAMGNINKQLEVLKKGDVLLVSNKLNSQRTGILSLMANAMMQKKQTDSAMYFLETGFQIALKSNDFLWCGKLQDQLASVMKDKGDYSRSLEHSKRALGYFEQIQEKGHIARTHANIGQTLIQAVQNKKNTSLSNPLQLAVYHLEQATQIATSISSLIVLQEYEGSLSEAYSLLGDHEKALVSYKKHRNYLDSLHDINRQKDFYKQLLELDFLRKNDSLMLIKRLDSEKLKNLKQENEIKSTHIRQLWLYFILAFLLLGSISWMAYQQKRNRIRALNLQLKEEIIAKQKEENVLQKKINDLSIQALQMQLNPHFVFNCLNSIKLYIEENKKDDASYFLTSFSTLIRKMLDATTKETHSINEEIEIIRLYLEMESMRLKEKLSWELNCDPSTEPDLVRIPTMLLQPIVENSIWHGLMPVQHGGRVGIFISKKIHTIEIEIKDSGIGLYQSKKNKSAHNELHASKGLEIVEERLRYFEKKYNKRCRFHMEDLSESNNENTTGTRVLISIESI